jgi:hypothetical protein
MVGESRASCFLNHACDPMGGLSAGCEDDAGLRMELEPLKEG